MPSPGWKLTVAEVWSSSGGVPSLARPNESAIEKHVACAAAISSSGLVRPLSSGSERDAQVTSRPPNAPLPVESIRPEPSIRPPFHVTSACRSTAIVPPRLDWALTLSTRRLSGSRGESGAELEADEARLRRVLTAHERELLARHPEETGVGAHPAEPLLRAGPRGDHAARD